MEAVLGEVTRRREARPDVFLSVMVALAGTAFVIGHMHVLGRTPRVAPPPSPCLLTAVDGYVLLDRVESLETCGARLEAVYLESGQPVAGWFGGLRVFADAKGVDASTGHGPRTTLITPPTRAYIDRTLVKLMAARGERPTMQIRVVRPPEGLAGGRR